MPLDNLRRQVDQLDEQILSLINQRYDLIKEAFQVKKKNQAPFYSPEREREVINRLLELNNGPLKENSLRAIYREILSGAMDLEHPLTVAFLGPQATFTQQAAIAQFGHSAKYEAKSSIADVFSDVETERVDYGCVPIENTTEGTVNHTLDLFINSTTQICAELNLRIHHNLMANCNFEDISRIYTHAQVMGQCRGWILEHLPHVELIETASTTKAAKLASEQENVAAIASSLASERYSLPILRENIEDRSHNTTRFFIIGRQESKPTGDDKTSICFAIKDKVGALYECLVPFKEEKVTMTMIESRPSKRKNWEYFFFADTLGHISDPAIQRALEKLEEMCQFVKILGSYPRTTKIF